MKAINRWMFGILQNSRKLRAAARKAEVSKTIESGSARRVSE